MLIEHCVSRSEPVHERSHVSLSLSSSGGVHRSDVEGVARFVRWVFVYTLWVFYDIRKCRVQRQKSYSLHPVAAEECYM